MSKNRSVFSDLSEELVEGVFRRLVAADVARCACVSRQWREYGYKFAKPKVVMKVHLGKRKLFLHDVEEDKVRWLWLPKRKQIQYYTVESSNGFLILMCSKKKEADSMYAVICDPLKNRWCKHFKVPAEYAGIATLWFGRKTLLLLTNVDGYVAIYNFESKAWTLGKATGSRGDFPLSITRIGEALEAYENYADQFSLLRLYPDRGETCWKRVQMGRAITFNTQFHTFELEHESVACTCSVGQTFDGMYKFQGTEVVRVPLFDEQLKPQLDKYHILNVFEPQPTPFEVGTGVLGWAITSSKFILYYVHEKKWKEVEGKLTRGVIHTTVSLSQSILWSKIVFEYELIPRERRKAKLECVEYTLG